MRLTPLACLTALAFLFVALPAANACTPADPTPEMAKLDRERGAVIGPNIWEQARKAADIAVVRAEFTDAPQTDIPARYRDDYSWTNIDMRPVRYVFSVVRVIKGAPPSRFAFQPPPALMLWRGDANTWTTRWDEENLDSFRLPHGRREFWRLGQGSMGYFSGGPGNCSNQIAFRLDRLYLVTRTADGTVTLVEELEDDDPLPDLVAQLTGLGSKAPLPFTLERYLALDGPLFVIKITSCVRGKARIVEAIKETPDADIWEWLGTRYSRFAGRACRPGNRYLVDGNLGETLFEIEDGAVIFDDSELAISFSGPTRIPLADVRRFANPSAPVAP